MTKKKIRNKKTGVVYELNEKDAVNVLSSRYGSVFAEIETKEQKPKNEPKKPVEILDKPEKPKKATKKDLD